MIKNHLILMIYITYGKKICKIIREFYKCAINNYQDYQDYN